MKMKIIRVDGSLPIPEYQTSGSVAFDLYSRIDSVIPAGKTAMLPANFIIKTPKGYMLMIAARSSLGKKKGLKLTNGIGIIDQDFCGENDELNLFVHNYTNQDVEIKKGERLCQAVFVKIDKAEWQEVNKMNDKSRGGWGSTG